MIESSAETESSPPRSRIRTTIIWLLFLGITAAILYDTVFHPKKDTVEKGHGRGFNGPVSVSVAAARKANMDLTLPVLGTVNAYNTATLRSRVDGELMKIHFTEGFEVKEGELLVEIDPRPFEVQKSQAEAQLARDNALLENGRLDLARFNTLLAQDSIPKQQVDTQAALVRQYEAALKLDDAQIKAALLQIDYCHIAAPISGRIGLRTVDVGNIIHAADATGIAVITQTRPIKVVFSVPQDAIPKVASRLASIEPMVAEAYDRDGTTLLASGKVMTLDNQIDTTTGTVKLIAEFPNADGRLFPNQFVNVRLNVEHLKDATVIPSAAVQHGNSGSYIYVVTDGKTVAMRHVDAGPSENGLTQITKGIDPGDVVVVDGIDKLREGAQVKVITPTTGPTEAAEAPPKSQHRTHAKQ